MTIEVEGGDKIGSWAWRLLGTERAVGAERLRVVDASVFPFVTNGNIYAPVMMVAEKAADLVLGNTPLAPAAVPYYRHRDESPLHPPGDPRNHA